MSFVYSQRLVNYSIPLKKLIDSLNIPLNQIHINIIKSDYVLNVKYQNQILKSFPVVFGTNPIDDKLMEGDRCTPEGTFKVKAKYPHKSWSKFIWFDYPNKDSFKKHLKAKQNKQIPQYAKIGGEVGIHGVPMGMDDLIDKKINWTWGCISMKTKDIEELFPYIYVGMKIIIIHSP